MKKKRLWVLAMTAVFGIVATSGSRGLAEEPQPAVDNRIEVESEEPGTQVSQAVVPDVVPEEVETDRVSVPVATPLEVQPQQQLASGEGVGAVAQAPILDTASSKLSFQALLTDASGDPLTGSSVDLRFKIWNGAVNLQTINMNNVGMVNGIVDTLIPVNNSNFNGDSRQLGVTLISPAAGELLPRIQLGAVPYAFRVDRVASEELDDSIELGTASANGNLKVWNDSGNSVGVELNGGSSTIITNGSDGLEQTKLWGPSWGELILHGRPAANEIGVKLGVPSTFILHPFPQPPTFIDLGGQLELYDVNGDRRVHSSASTTGGTVQVYNSSGAITARMTGGVGDYETLGSFDVMDTLAGFDMATLYKYSGGGRVIMHDENDRTTFFGGSTSAGGFLQLYQADGSLGVVLDADAGNANGGGQISIRNAAGSTRILLEADEGGQGAGQIIMRNGAGTTTIEIDSDWGGNGDGRVVTSELQITGGSDLSEQFDIAPGSGEVKSGMVVSIDPARPGRLIVSGKAYDRTVAGIISGAGGVKPGMLMGQRGTEANGAKAVALTGRVYCWCDASSGPIQPGDLLTTSNTPGHAMKVTDHMQSHGATIGKAMTSLESGKGLVLVLVSLQ